jgi:hypothetical protein
MRRAAVQKCWKRDRLLPFRIARSAKQCYEPGLSKIPQCLRRDILRHSGCRFFALRKSSRTNSLSITQTQESGRRWLWSGRVLAAFAEVGVNEIPEVDATMSIDINCFSIVQTS